jgi:hypothetical protein
MAYEIPGFKSGTLVTSVDLSNEAASQYTGVKVKPDGSAGLPAAGGQITGVVQNDPAIGETVEIMHTGVSKVQAGAVFPAGSLLTPDATGRFVPVTAGQFAVAEAWENGVAVGGLVTALIMPFGKQ